VIIKHLGQTDYLDTLAEMQQWTKNREKDTENQLWITSHNSVFTHGISSTNDNIITSSTIPVVNTDRGGQITYHGKGQIIIYMLLDLKQLGFGVKKLVWRIEEALIVTLGDYNIVAKRKDKAPGVYVDSAKIAALGLKVKNFKTYHGLSLNVAMDLYPFSLIKPCGYDNLQVCQMQDFVKQPLSITEIEQVLCKHLQTQLTQTARKV
jgi:lipoyl(octanoyl) transferase